MELVIGVAGMIALAGVYVLFGLGDRGGSPCRGCGASDVPDGGCGACAIGDREDPSRETRDAASTVGRAAVGGELRTGSGER